MKVVEHEPSSWFLLAEEDRLFLDVRVSRSAADFALLVEFTAEEREEYRVIGELFLHYLAARIENFPDQYLPRNLSAQRGADVTRAIEQWREAAPASRSRPRAWSSTAPRGDAHLYSPDDLIFPS